MRGKQIISAFLALTTSLWRELGICRGAAGREQCSTHRLAGAVRRAEMALSASRNAYLRHGARLPGKDVEMATISWLPSTGKVLRFATKPEQGKCYSLAETMDWAAAVGWK